MGIMPLDRTMSETELEVELAAEYGIGNYCPFYIPACDITATNIDAFANTMGGIIVYPCK